MVLNTMKTPFLFQQKLKLAVRDGAGERTFPVHVLNRIFSVREVSLPKPRALGDSFLSLRNASVPVSCQRPSLLICQGLDLSCHLLILLQSAS